MMLHFLEHDDFTLVIPGTEDKEWYQRNMEYSRQMNREYLEALAEPPKGGRLSGSFIYSHPPDYIGRPTMAWGASQWSDLFRELKAMGVDTAIYQAAVWLEVRESNYPSRLFADFKTWDSIAQLCEAASRERMTLFLGGLGNLMCFDVNATSETYQRDRDAQLECFCELKELYGGGFQGFYMSPETGYPGGRQPEREVLLNQYFKQVCEGVKAEMPGLPILLSPGTYYIPNHDQDIYDFLFAIFKDCPIDIMAPQDSIGTFGNRLLHLKPSFEIWSRLCKTLGFALWVNAESFERVDIGTAQDFVSADFRRLAVQLSHASQVAEKIVSWEVPYFYSSLAGERGIRLRREYLSSLERGER
jgi:hypothetical protein